MKIAVFSDTHLGKKNFKVAERENDFLDAFKKVIDYAIESKCEAVIHAGDLFDTSRPSIEILLFSVSQLKRIKSLGIPFFVISGSHDIGANNTFLNVFDSLGLCKNLSNPRYYKINEDGSEIILNGEIYNGLFVCGIPGKSNISSELECLKPNLPNDCFKVFLMHHIIEDINPLFASVKKSMIPKGFDLCISGHWHERFESKLNDCDLIYPGGTERCDLNEMKSREKGFYIIDTKSKSREFIKLELTNSKIHEIKSNNLGPNEIIESMKNLISPSNGEMIFFILKGKMKSGSKAEIARNEIFDLALKRGYLLSKIYMSELFDSFQTQVVAGKKSAHEIEIEFFESRGFGKLGAKSASKIIDLANSSKESLKDEIELELKGLWVAENEA